MNPPEEPKTAEQRPNPSSPHKRDLTVAAVTASFLIAIFGGSYAAKQLLESGAAVRTLQSARAETQAIKAPVPFLGPFAFHKKGVQECGPAVRLMEGALRNTKPKIRKAPPQNCVGKATKRQIQVFQKRHHIPQSGEYGLRTHRALASHYSKKQVGDLRFLADQKIRKLHYITIGIITAHAKTFERRMQYCDFGSLSSCGQRGVWPRWPDVPHHTDCSGYVSWVYFQAGLPNPNGSGVGSTRTLIYHGTPITHNGPLHVGDLIFYGSNTHVAIYIGHGLVSSHGQAYINIHPYNYRPIYAVRRYF